MKNKNDLTLLNLSLPLKVLFTGYILVIGLGLLMAGAQIMLTHGMADGKPGLSVDDIVYSYYGHRNGSKLESKLKGSMKNKATKEENFTLLTWVRKGADEAVWNSRVKPIVDAKCARCHGVVPGLPDITKYSEIKKLTEIDSGASISALTRVSHIHLFGIAFIFFFIGYIFSLAIGFKPWVKAGLIFIPFAFLILDVASWWLTKINPGFAWLVIIGGFGYSMAAGVMLFTSLYQMWVMPFKNKAGLKQD